VEHDLLVSKWDSNPMSFWQNQLNFAVWCATTGCGISSEDHLTTSKPLDKSVYSFHVYYQVRRILHEMKCPLPSDPSWNAFANGWDQGAYERICHEFDVSMGTDWRQKQSENRGLGTVYLYVYKMGYYPQDRQYNSSEMSFTKTTTNRSLHIDYISQGSEADGAWRRFVLDKSVGFTRTGVEHLNASIWTYCWAILGAQGQTRTSILGTGTAFDAQKQYLADVEDAVRSPVDLPASIARYQNTLRYARSQVDYVLGSGLYMLPSDMELQIGVITNYNNEIVVATKGMPLGKNEAVNNLNIVHSTVSTVPRERATPTLPTPTSTSNGAELHEKNKTALIVLGTGIMLAVLWLTYKSKQ
jgi:hypothetical protein